MTTAAPRFELAWVGMAAGPLAWALSFEGNFLLTQWQCLHSVQPVPYVGHGEEVSGPAFPDQLARDQPDPPAQHMHRGLTGIGVLGQHRNGEELKLAGLDIERQQCCQPGCGTRCPVELGDTGLKRSGGKYLRPKAAC